MSRREVFAPHLGRNVRLGGRKRPAAVGPHLKLKNYLRAGLPAAPPTGDYSDRAQESLTNIFLNDTYGDCVIAGANHIQGVLTGNADGGAPFVATREQIIADYSAVGGFDPNNPQATDNGCDLQTAMNYYVQHGFADGTKLMGWLAVDAGDAAEVAAALFLFENLYLGDELPEAWVNPFPSAGGTWDVAGDPVPQNGHCVMACGWDLPNNRIKLWTWGIPVYLTLPALAKYNAAANGGELYVLLSQAQLAKGQSKAPNGVDWTSLLADWDSIGGTVPISPPAPVPTPTPGAAVTLAQAQAMAQAGLMDCHRILTRGQAISAVNQALSNGWPVP